MRPAAVGHHCPECVAEGARTVRAPRTAFGGAVREDTSRVTMVLVGLNVLAYLAGLALGADTLRADYGNVAGPAVVGDGEVGGVAAGQAYRLLTAAFLHAGLVHVALNMAALVVLGPALEELLGRARFLTVYLLSALGGSVTAYVLAAPNTLSVGASGAIFGLFGAHYVAARRTGGDAGPVLTMLAINLVITFALPFIDWRAHLGGLLTGAVVTATLVYAPRAQRVLVQVTGCAAVGVLLASLVVVRTAALT